MFGFLKKNEIVEIAIDGESYLVDEKVKDFITVLRNKLTNAERELFSSNCKNRELKEQLKETYKVQDEVGLKPAYSEDCVDCKYAVLSERTSQPIGCRKDRLCNDFVPFDD